MSNPEEISYESTTRRLERPAPSAAGTTSAGDSSGAQPCALIEDLLPLYIEGEVSPGSRDLIVEHLAQCAHCAGFLAGAQSVRAQLRQEQRQRAAVLVASAPDRQVVAQGRRGMALITTLAACFAGFLGSTMFWGGLEGHEPGLSFFGTLLGITGFWLMAMLTRKLGLLTSLRFATLLVLWAGISLITIMLSLAGGGPIGILIWPLASIIIWLAATSGGPGFYTPAGAATQPAPRTPTSGTPSARSDGQGSSRLLSMTLSARQITGMMALGLVVAGSALAFSWLTYDARLISTLVLIGLGAYLWTKDRTSS